MRQKVRYDENAWPIPLSFLAYAIQRNEEIRRAREEEKMIQAEPRAVLQHNVQLKQLACSLPCKASPPAADVFLLTLIPLSSEKAAHSSF